IGEKSNKVFFKAHSLILQTRSPYFEELLSRYGNKGPKNVIFDKPNINPKLFKILLSYIYDGTVDLTELEFKEIIYFLWGAQVLCLEELCEYIENIIVVMLPDLINEHISLINRKGLSKFTKLTELVRKFVYDNVEISSAMPMQQPNIQSNLIEQKPI
ncbi:37115_t:CDS:2, partial [Gigaspora margarita]